jgi:hypothetical protein
MEQFTTLIAVLAFCLAGVSAVFMISISRRTANNEKISIGTAERLAGLIKLIEQVGGGQTPTEPVPPEGDKEGDLLWGDFGEWVEQERKKTGWKDRRGKVN